VVSVVRGLVEASPRRSVVIDAVANALKARGFQRPPGSPRLVTRLRRIREIVVSPSGVITLAEEAKAPRNEPSSVQAASEPVADVEPQPGDQPGYLGGPDDESDDPEIDGNRWPASSSEPPEIDGNRVTPPAATAAPAPGRRRRRRRWRGGPRRPASAPPTA
jgi:hypothetical protein